MAEIGIREFKQQASKILKEVREEGATYTITYQGQPCGILVPYSTSKGHKKRGKRKGVSKNVSLRGIWKDGPDIPWEEFMEVKKVWDAHVDSLVKEITAADEPKEGEGG